MNVDRIRLGCAGVLLALLCGCTTLPTAGEVHTRANDDDASNQAPYFRPPGPRSGDSPTTIVRGFLRAMQANPPSIAVARSFLSDRAKATWRPQGTIVYDGSTVDASGSRVTARLRGSHRLSPQGAWLDGTDTTTATLPISVVEEDGEWRIDNPPNVLAVPATYFPSLFVGLNLYFFDRTGTVLVPTRVYVLRGEDTATNLVRGLLAGPPPGRRDVAVSAFPPGMDDPLAVVVNEVGRADVPLGPAVLDLAPAELNRVVVQLARTLRQVPGITRLRLTTVDGAPVTMADGSTDVSVTVGADYDPVSLPQRELLAISGGRVVRVDSNQVEPADGPFGRTGFALRSLAWSTTEHTLAAVSDNGRRVFVSPDRGSRAAKRVRSVLDGATNVLRPAYDRFGGLWIVDATKAGAVVHLIAGGQDRIIPVEGISGRPVSAFTVTRDGTSLAAVLRTGTNPTLAVSDVVRARRGRVERVEPARTLQLSSLNGADLGTTRDVAQNGPTSVAVLTRPSDGPDEIVYVELDGSPGSQGADASAPTTVPDQLDDLVASPDPALSLRVLTDDGRLFTLEGGSGWVREQPSGVIAATYAE